MQIRAQSNDRLGTRARSCVARIAACTGAVCLAAAFLTYAETRAFHFDEAYHLLTAQLILAGKRPYVDFSFPQAPWNAYWNALWMALLSPSWRIAHALSALETIGAVLLIAGYLARRFPDPEWRIAAAATAGIAIGLNPMVFAYGGLAQPYGICLFALAAAFRCAVRAAETEGLRYHAAAGLFAGIAAASSLLAAIALPVLLVWTQVHNRAPRRRKAALAFVSAAALPFAPVVWLFALAPRAAWFNLVQYHVYYRRLYWPGTTGHDFEVLTSWLYSAPAVLLGLLAACGWLYVRRHSGWPRPRQAEFYLCGWLALALAAEVAAAHPTFEQYFLLTVPFLAIPAAAGVYALAVRLFALRSRALPLCALAAIFSLALVRYLYDHRGYATWSAYERLARQVDSVTPPNAPLFAREQIYFLTRRIPPSGLELYYTHLLELPPADRTRFHLLTDGDLRRQLSEGRFATAFDCDNDTVTFDLDRLYRRSRTMDDCTVYWDFHR